MNQATDEKTRPRSILESFIELGRDGNEGKAFAITQRALKDQCCGDITELLASLRGHNVGYTPVIWRDLLSGNYLVERAAKDGRTFWRAGPNCERVA